MNKYLLIALLFTQIALLGQKYTISGYISDSETGERLSDAAVFDSVSAEGVYTNKYGFYSLSSLNNNLKLYISYVGYKTKIVDVELNDNRSLNIEIQPDMQLSEVVVAAAKENDNYDIQTLSSKEIIALPSIAGESDFFKTLHLFPGILAGSEGSSSFYVRGGGDGQNLILLDGVPVYNTDHLYGFLSVFNAYAISGVNIYTGGFPARYGGKLSSVVDVRMKEGNNKQWHGNFNLGLISSNFTIEGPIVKNKTSVLFALRRTYLDVLSRPFFALLNSIQSEDSVSLGYYFYDLNFKINHIFNNKNRLFFSFYAGKDKLYADQASSSSYLTERINNYFLWGNTTAVLRWNYKYNDKLFSNTGIYFSKYKSENTINTNEIDNTTNYYLQKELYQFSSNIRSLSSQIDWDWQANNTNSIKFGVNFKFLFFNPGNTINDLYFNNQHFIEKKSIAQINAKESFVYIEDNINYKNFKFNFGVHNSAYFADSIKYLSFQPRIKAQYYITDKASVYSSYTEMTQNIHSLVQNSIDLSVDIYMPSTSVIKPMYAKQIVFGSKYSFKKNMSLKFESYYKTMRNLIEYKEGANYLENQTNWEDLVTVGKGNSYGIELIFDKKTGTFHSWFSYALSWANREFNELNSGNVFPFKYDRRHNFSVACMLQLNEKINISTNWVYYTGSAYTLIESLYSVSNINAELTNIEIQKQSTRNAHRMPDYHRLDLGVNFVKTKKRGTRTWCINIYNAYNKLNPYYSYIGEDNGKYILKQVCVAPIIPTISYSYTF